MITTVLPQERSRRERVTLINQGRRVAGPLPTAPRTNRAAGPSTGKTPQESALRRGAGRYCATPPTSPSRRCNVEHAADGRATAGTAAAIRCATDLSPPPPCGRACARVHNHVAVWLPPPPVSRASPHTVRRSRPRGSGRRVGNVAPCGRDGHASRVVRGRVPRQCPGLRGAACRRRPEADARVWRCLRIEVRTPGGRPYSRVDGPVKRFWLTAADTTCCRSPPVGKRMQTRRRRRGRRGSPVF